MAMAMSYPLSPLASVVAPLPPMPEGEVLTAAQWDTLLSICEAFVPSIESSAENTNHFKFLPENAPQDTLSQYLSESVTSIPDFKSALHRQFGHYVPAEALAQLSFIFSALDTRLGSLTLTGYVTPISAQPLSVRTAIVKGWANSWIPPLRSLFRALSAVAITTWIDMSPTYPRMIDFPSVPKHIERNDSFRFDFLQFEEASVPAELETDIVIIGSGCGAGVAASHLSATGHKVLVMEKSYHYSSSHFPMASGDARKNMLENGFAVIADDNSIAVLAGSTWGGGGTVNWSATLHPQHFVREEWSSEGLPFFTSSEFTDCLDTVCEKMGAPKSTDHKALENIEHNFANETLIEGARRLGMAAETVPQNTGGKRHFCGYCGEGCASATKQGPANRWLPDAAAHGAQFMEGAWAEEILFESAAGEEKKAVGVRAVWTSRDRKFSRTLVVKAKKVIVAAGTLQSPLLLLRSGLTNPNIGRNLHLHPVSSVAAVYPHEVKPWEGAILTSAVTSMENLDGLHHGPKIEVIASTPYYMLPFMPWRASLENPALDLKVQLAKFHHMSGYISLQRDRDTGRVYPDPVDPRRVRVQYTASQRDVNGILEGVVAIARIVYAMGATEIHPLNALVENFVRRNDGTDEERFAGWLAEVRKVGFKSPDSGTLGSAHQMGTCRMSASPKGGVVDQRGQVWGPEGLYVSDASVFPSASGVNPMVTTMGISEWISRGLVKVLEKEGR